MNIWLNKITDMNPNDIKNINLLNHYIGMKEVPEFMLEFIVFPAVVFGMVVFGVVIAFVGNYRWPLIWFTVMSILGCIGMWDFYRWEKDYGSSLDPRAAIKFVDANEQPMHYQPPLLGTKVILNFTAHSYPQVGVLFLCGAMGLMASAYQVGKKEFYTMKSNLFSN